jgi:hypothetical protein
MFRKGKGHPYALSWALRKEGADMTALEGFLLGLMLASIPSYLLGLYSGTGGGSTVWPRIRCSQADW